MTLRPGNVTVASQVMLPTDVVFAAALGLTWMLQPPLAAGAALNSLSGVWSITNTALVLLLLAVVQGAALLWGNRTMEEGALAAGMIVYVLLGVLLIAGHAEGSSYSASYWPWYVAIAHLASLLSVIFYERKGHE